VKTLCVAAMLATLSSTVFLMVLYTNDSTSDRYARYQRRMQDLLFSFDPSLFPNASGIFNRSFGFGGQDQSRPQFPLSSSGGIFLMLVPWLPHLVIFPSTLSAPRANF
jgi:hypothetical protein